MATIEGLIANAYERIPTPIRILAMPATTPAGAVWKLATGILPHDLRHLIVKATTHKTPRDSWAIYGKDTVMKCENHAAYSIALQLVGGMAYLSYYLATNIASDTASITPTSVIALGALVDLPFRVGLPFRSVSRWSKKVQEFSNENGKYTEEEKVIPGTTALEVPYLGAKKAVEYVMRRSQNKRPHHDCK